jgi:triacylglycerol lipase
LYNPTGFDRRRAIQLAELVDQAYLQYDAFMKNEAWTLPGTYSLAAELKYAGTQSGARGLGASFEKEFRQLARSRSHGGDQMPIGFVACRKSEVFLIFRGTMTTTEWIRDFSIHLTTYPYKTFGKVHDGFIQTYDGFRKGIQDSLGRLGPGRKLFIAGHSLGAALATLAAPDVVSMKGVKAATVYTFGSPRVGDRTFADDYNSLFRERSFRIANSSDIVVAMPFPVPFLGFLGGYFTHVETAVDFTLQQEDVEKNHEMNTYMHALKTDTDRRGLLRGLFN